MIYIGKLIDLTGKKFGKLTVLYKNSRRSSGGILMTYWHCKCECGNECDKSPKYLRDANSFASCGKCSPQKLRVDSTNLTGNRYGRLTVVGLDMEKRKQQLEDVKNKKKSSYRQYWICDCDCGNSVSVRQDALENGITVSCGCYQKEIAREIGISTRKTNNFYEENDYLIIQPFNDDRKIKIDKEDYEKVKDYCWCTSHGYAIAVIRESDNKQVRMHRLIMNCGKDEEFLVIDHINHDTLDNRKCNLRIATNAENNWNSNTSHNAGIKYNDALNKWNVFIHYKLQPINLGAFPTYDEALDIRNKAEEVFYGEFQFNEKGVI